MGSCGVECYEVSPLLFDVSSTCSFFDSDLDSDLAEMRSTGLVHGPAFTD